MGHLRPPYLVINAIMYSIYLYEKLCELASLSYQSRIKHSKFLTVEIDDN